MTTRHHTLDIYGAELHLATDRRGWAALRRRLTYLGPAPEAAGQASFAVFHPSRCGLSVPHIVIWIDQANHPDRLDLVDTCAHEASHAANALMQHIGHSDDAGNNEPLAYLVGWLTRWILEGCEA